jgi:hypothetical protein
VNDFSTTQWQVAWFIGIHLCCVMEYEQIRSNKFLRQMLFVSLSPFSPGANAALVESSYSLGTKQRSGNGIIQTILWQNFE